MPDGVDLQAVDEEKKKERYFGKGKEEASSELATLIWRRRKRGWTTRKFDINGKHMSNGLKCKGLERYSEERERDVERDWTNCLGEWNETRRWVQVHWEMRGERNRESEWWLIM